MSDLPRTGKKCTEIKKWAKFVVLSLSSRPGSLTLCLPPDLSRGRCSAITTLLVSKINNVFF